MSDGFNGCVFLGYVEILVIHAHNETKKTPTHHHYKHPTSFTSTPQAETRLLEEQKRVTDYLNASTEPKLRAIVEEELVKAHATTLVEVRSSLRI